MTARQRIKKLYLRFRGAALGAIPLPAGAWPRQGAPREAIRRILFIRLDRVGDVVLSTPAIEALKRGFPRAEITVLLRPQTAALLENNPHVDRLVVLDPGAGPAEQYRVLQDLRQQRFDFAIDPCVDWKLSTALIAWASGARFRIGYPCGGREAFFTMIAGQPDSHAHMADVILGTLVPLGIDRSNRQPRLYLTDEERNRAVGWLAERTAGVKPLVGIHPGAFYETQRWPPEHFAALADRLQGRFDVILFGGPADEGLVQQIQSLMPGRTLKVVTPDIRWFAALSVELPAARVQQLRPPPRGLGPGHPHGLLHGPHREGALEPPGGEARRAPDRRPCLHRLQPGRLPGGLPGLHAPYHPRDGR